MASIRIPFPEKDEPGTVLLQGPRVTVGRLPFNTLQIIDRTISGFHAELILDNGHYRLHDRGSTNGTFVNGTPATDFHLREACKISFGTVECEFDPATEAAETGDSIPTRDEINAVRQENATLRGTLAGLRQEVATLREAKPGTPASETVAREEFTKVVAERQALTEKQLGQDQEIARLKNEVAVLRRDRENLQKAWDATKAEMAKVQRPLETAAFVEVPTVVVAPPAAPKAPEPPAHVPAISSPPPVPPSRPAVPVSKPMAPVAPPAVPSAAPTVRAMPVPRPAAPPGPPARPVPVQPVPAQNSSGVRPFPRAVPGSASVPTVAMPKPASPLQPRAAVTPVPPPTAGPKGTQKIV